MNNYFKKEFSFSRFTRFSIKEQTLFAKRLSFLVTAGLPLLECMHLIRAQTKSKPKAKIFDTIINDIANGQYLSSSLRKHKKLFGDFAVNIIRVGEQSGILSQNLAYLADELHKKHALRRKVIGTLVYPIFITVATLGLTSGTVYSGALVQTGLTAGLKYSYKIQEKHGGSVVEQVATNIVPAPVVNTAPVSQNATVSTNQDTPLPVTMVATDVDGNGLTYSIVGNPTHGALGTVSGNSVTYTPTAGYFGPDSFTFKANDGSLDSNTSTVNITVNHVNHAPVLAAIANASIPELALFTTTASATDVDTDTLVYSLSGSVPAGMSIDSSTGVISWTPTEAQGPASYPITVGVSDGHGGTDSKGFTVTVTEGNTAPVATDATVSTHMNTPRTITLVANDADLPAQTITYTITVPPTHGLLGTIVGTDVVYTPDTNYVGDDSFTFTANDGTTDSNSATVTINVDDNAPSLGEILDQVIDELSPLNFTISASDFDADPLTFSFVGSVPAGVSLDGTSGAFSWTPAEDQGPALYNFLASVTDGAGTDSLPFTVTVNEVNTPPVAADSAVITDEDVATSQTLAATDSDIPANTLVFATTTSPTHGALTAFDSSNGSFTYAPDANYNGSDTFSFSVSDATSTSNVAVVNITVNAVNDAPVITLLGDNPLAFVATSSPFVDPSATSTDVEDGVLTPVVTGTVDASTVGTYTLTYTATDSGGLSASTTRTVLVTAAPVENTSALCSDGIDNDSDGLVDLADSDCAAFIPAPPAPPSGGGGGGGGGSGNGSNVVVVPAGNGGAVGGGTGGGLVLGAETGPSDCDAYLGSYIKFGVNNDTGAVTKLQQFLNNLENNSLNVNGTYDEPSLAAVKAFQQKYAGDILSPWGANDPTGYVYYTTTKKINEVECNFSKAFPLSADQLQEIARIKALGEPYTAHPAVHTSGSTKPQDKKDKDAVVGSNTDLNAQTAATANIPASKGWWSSFWGWVLHK